MMPAPRLTLALSPPFARLRRELSRTAQGGEGRKLAHLDVPAGALLRALLAAGAEFHFETVRLTPVHRFDDGLVLAVLPAVAAVEAQAAAHAALRLDDGLVPRQAQVHLPIRVPEALGHRDR